MSQGVLSRSQSAALIMDRDRNRASSRKQELATLAGEIYRLGSKLVNACTMKRDLMMKCDKIEITVVRRKLWIFETRSRETHHHGRVGFRSVTDVPIEGIYFAVLPDGRVYLNHGGVANGAFANAWTPLEFIVGYEPDVQLQILQGVRASMKGLL